MYAIRRNFLLLKRRSVLSKYEPDLDTTQNIHELGVPKSMRSTRAGSRKIRSIPTIITSQRRDNIHYQYGPNYSNLVMVANHDLHPCSNTIPVITTVRDTVVKKTHFKPTANTTIHRVPLTPRWTNLKCVLWNSRSLNNKTPSLCDFIISEGIDILSVTESWLRGDFHDQYVLGELSTVMRGYTFYHQPRKSRGGGVGVLVKSNLQVKKNSTQVFKSFEYIDLSIRSGPRLINLVTIYRPPPSAKNKNTHSGFTQEFSTLLETLSVAPGSLLLNGDFNYHMDSLASPEVARFADVIDSANLVQHVKSPTHQKGHILDLVISRQSEDIVSSVSISRDLPSDHYAVVYNLNLTRPGPMKHESASRNYRNIDMDKLKQDITLSDLNVQITSDPSCLATNYDSTIKAIIDDHAPVQSKSVTLRPRIPWFSNDLLLAKKEKRRLERKWLSSKLLVDYEIYRDQCKSYQSLLQSAKSEYHRNRITESDDKKLFSIVSEMAGKNTTTSLPVHTSKVDLANNFSDFFTSKVDKLKKVLACHTEVTANRLEDEEPCTKSFLRFQPVSAVDVVKFIQASPTKGCPLDPAPTWLLKECVLLLAPAITRIVNSSFVSSHFPSTLKKALVTPLIKKPSLDADVYANYRPVSNLSFLSKLLERVAVHQLQEYLSQNNLLPVTQSAYRKHHSTETALLRVQNDILRAVDKHQEVFLVLLDLSAAFDTLDHEILLNRLEKRFGIKENALAWFSSYLEDRFQSVTIGGITSKESKLTWGVPQGSVMGPVLFSTYTAPLEEIITAHGVSCMIYADDTQLYLTMKPHDRQDTKSLLELCIRDVKTWMTTNQLKLNDDKTEIVHFSSKYLPRPPIMNIQVGDSKITPSDIAKNIGVIFDKVMSMSDHISKVTKAASVAIWWIGKISHLLDQTSRERLVHAFVSSQLDYCNSLLYGLSNTEIMKLQRIQNTAARLVTKTSKYDSISLILSNLHWLPVSKRIEYKILLLTYKSLNNAGPKYLSDLLEVNQPCRASRSSSRGDLVVPRTSSKNYGDRAYSVCAPKLWNTLPADIRQSGTPTIFKNKLKTFLFSS